MKKHLLLYSSAIIVVLASCQKEDINDTPTGIDGTYKLKYLTAKTNSIVTITDGQKTITTSDYTTTDNQGTMTFNNSTLTATGISYTLDTEFKGYLYNGVDLIDSLTFPFSYTLPPSNAVAQYQLVGADSIYFPQGSITTGAGGTGIAQSGASGGRYSMNGNIFTLTQYYTKDSTFLDSGETIRIHNTAVASTVMEKQ